MSVSTEEVRRITSGLKTTSDKIRALHRVGWPRSKIADALKIRYQHVRNVLVQDEARAARALDTSRELRAPKPTKIRVGPDGRVVIPAAFREVLGLKDGDVLFGSVEHGEIHLLTTAAAIRRAQALVREFVPEGVSLVDELLEDRRREVEREAKRG